MFRTISLVLAIVIGFIGTTATAQTNFEAQTHFTLTAGDLGEITGGGIGNIVVGIGIPISKGGPLNAILKAGWNEYGGLDGTGVLKGFKFRARGFPFTGGVRLYDESRQIFVEGGLGVEVKSGHLSFAEDRAETTATAFLGSVGAGAILIEGLGLVASLNISTNSWRYANIGLMYRFGN